MVRGALEIENENLICKAPWIYTSVMFEMYRLEARFWATLVVFWLEIARFDIGKGVIVIKISYSEEYSVTSTKL